MSSSASSALRSPPFSLTHSLTHYSFLNYKFCTSSSSPFQRHTTAFREVHNALRQDVTRIGNENDDLARQTGRLSEKAARVELVESNLDKMVSTQGQSVTSFCALVKENKGIQQKQQDLVVAQVAQQLMTSIVRADRDGDFTISEQEVTQLLFSIKAIKGVENIDEAALKTLLLSGNGQQGGKNCIAGVFDLVKSMYLDNRASGGGGSAGIKSRELDLNRGGGPSVIQLRRL